MSDTLHTSLIKHDIYQKVHYIHNRDVYQLPEHLAQAFELLDELITRLLLTVDKKAEEKRQVG